MKETIRGKAIVLTGASAGIGRAAALGLAREGARLFLVARRADRLAEVDAEVRKLGGTAFVQALDLRHADSVKTMIRSACEKLGRIDVLINNAAFGYFGTVEKTPPALVREIFEVNFEAPLLASQLVIPIMKRQGGGHIINVSSVVGKRGLPMSGIYSATKFALNGLSESLRIELRDSNIRVSLINPASTKTEFSEALRRVDVSADFGPIGHQQSAEEVADAIVRCVHRPKLEVYPYWPSRLVAWFNVLAPSFVDAVTIRYLRERIPSHQR